MVTLASGVAAVPRVLVAPKRAIRFKGYLLVLPAVIYVLALIGFPLVLGVWYSLTDTTVARDGHFIGLKNFVDAARDPTFRLATRNTLIIAAVATAAQITLTARRTFAWKWMFNSQFSVINWLLRQGGVIDQNIQWLGTPVPAMIA